MKTIFRFSWFLLLSSILIQTAASQTPQHFNANTGGIGNSIPFGSLSQPGWKGQYLIGPNEYIQPTPAPSGWITKFYINTATSGGPITISNLLIKMGQNTFTSFPAGEYTGQLDTVYYRSSVSITGVAGTWLLFTLDNPYNYDSTKSLIIDISHCSFTGTGFTIWQSAGTTGIFRRNNLPGSSTCIFNYSGQDTRIIQSGVDIDQMIGITHQNNNIPSEYSLEQNYPNPFNPVTNFRFRIPEQGFVSLIIYDNLGREAGTVIKSELTPGIYDFEWDASGLSSGVYYYTLTAGKFSATKKLALIK